MPTIINLTTSCWAGSGRDVPPTSDAMQLIVHRPVRLHKVMTMLAVHSSSRPTQPGCGIPPRVWPRRPTLTHFRHVLGVSHPAAGAAWRQLDHELTMISALGMAGYFLIVWDIVAFAQRSGIWCQGARAASAAANTVSANPTPAMGWPASATVSRSRSASWLSPPQ